MRSGEAYVRLAAGPIRDAMQTIQQARPLLGAAVNAAKLKLDANERIADGKASETSPG